MRTLLLLWLALFSAPALAGSSSFQPQVNYDLTATIAVDTATSGEVDLGGTMLVGVFLPATFDGTTLKISAASASGGTFVTVETGAGTPADVTLTASAHSKFVPLAAADRDIVRGLRFIKLVAGSTQTTTSTVITFATIPTK
jgi:hypothetical protein